MSADAFDAQFERETDVRLEHGLQLRTLAEHADFVLRHPWLFGSRPGPIIRGALEVIAEDAPPPSRWVHINADQPSETARFKCAACGCVSKRLPRTCVGKGCTDATVEYGSHVGGYARAAR